MKIIKKALLPSPVQANTTDEKIKGEFPRIRARITSKHTLFAFTTFTDGRWVFIKMTGKPHYFAPKYDTFHSLYRTGFGARLKNAVPNTLIFHWIAIDYIEICEGCESKKHKISVVRACAHTREGGKDEDREHQKYFSEVRIILLQASNKNIGRFPKNVRHFPKNVGDNFKNVGDKFMNVRLSLWALLDMLNFRWIIEVCIWGNHQNLVPLQMWKTGNS